jgi:hypothetical protein
LLLRPPSADVPPVVVKLPTLAGYDELFGVGVCQESCPLF